jgi:alkylation response protein AidB-like acyl-CoA dehydrogenase
MTPFTPQVAEQRFLLDHIAGLPALAATNLYAAATPDLVDAVLEGAGSFAAAEFAPLNQPGDRTGARSTTEGVTMPPGFAEAYRAYVDGGWGTILGPEEHGGQGMPFALATAVLEDLGTANMAFSLIMMLTPGAVEALMAHGSAEQQATWLPNLVSGRWNGTMCLTEAQAGSDVGALRTRAVRQPDGTYRIKGQKIFITFGEHDLTDNIVHLVLARTPDAPAGTRGISLFLVPRFRLDEAGIPSAPNDVRAVSIEHKMGIHASPTCVMAFGDEDDCIGELVGAEHGGMRAMFTMMNNARLNVGLQGVSIAERARQQAASFARDRVQSARAGAATRDAVAIFEHPDVRRMLLRMAALTQGARALVYYAAGLVDRAHLGEEGAQARLDLLTPLAKAYGTDVGVEVASLAVQVHGGTGFIEETGAAQHYRDARIAPIYEGTNGIQAADLVGRKLGLDGGAAFAALLGEIRSDSRDAGLIALADAVETLVADLGSADIGERLAGSYPLLTMLSVAVCAWLMERQGEIASRDHAAGAGDPAFLAVKAAAARYYLAAIVREAAGLAAGVRAGAAAVMAVEPALLAAG